MTSEVVLLNKSCVALAADSATTVSYWEKGELRTRYFKGANKIVNLSDAHPVGLMTYGSASLQGIPWEIIAKAYRQYLKTKAHDELPAYAQDFFDFIATNAHMFPVATQEEQFKEHVGRVVEKILDPVLGDKSFSSVADDKSRKVVFDPLFDQQRIRVREAKFLAGAAQADADSACARFGGEIKAVLEADKWHELVPRERLGDLADVAILGVYKEGFTDLQSTGLVLAGYGDKEYFPRMELHCCSGIVLGKLLRAKKNEVAIDQDNTSGLVPLAMSEMIGTFVWGISDNGFEQILTSFRNQAKGLLDVIRAAGHIPAATEVGSFVEDAVSKHARELVGYLGEYHRMPLHRVIGCLPRSEMAELAEALVFMESMKERVTTPAESVAGPIDVAVISKGDGFIWTKRKHYFDPKLNPRFFTRHAET